MRSAPIGLFYEDLDTVCEVARASSVLTHGHPAALESAAGAALLVALALRGAGPADMYRELERRLFGRAADFDACMRKVPAALELPPERALTSEVLGESWVGDEAVASALYCVWRHADDYRAAVLTAVNTDGDSDSIATIVGSIMGARLGIGAIPAHWVAGVERSRELHDLAARLLTASRRR
jgi:ADP-ribosylglycohydrolase